MIEADSDCDVAIVGGGLAGLTLALQLHQASPDLTIEVLERSRLPPPRAAHKVGEATVEIGARYLAKSLGLESLLESTQLHKFGLRMFFGSGCHQDLSRADELGSSRFLPARSYQLDRGLLEANLVDRLVERGLTVQDGSVVREAKISANGQRHELQVVHRRRPRRVRCRWLVDASSRNRMLKRTLHLDRMIDHRMCAAWLRLDGVIDVDSWSDSGHWKELCQGSPRRLSTNHLMGPGYWAWIIPLADDRTSVGLVTDPAEHPLSSYNTFQKLLDWFGRHQPQLGRRIADQKNALLDFRTLRNLSQGSTEVWSASGWALAGEAGVFTDPFYSPGSDFIAIGNTFIADLIVQKRSDGDRAVHAAVYQKMYQSFFDSTLSLYQNQYPGFGDTELMVVKSTWDYAYYWSILSWMFFRGVMTDLSFLRRAQPDLLRIRALNSSMQSAFRHRATARNQDRGKGRFFDQSAIPILAELNASLLESGGNVDAELAGNCRRLDELAPRLLALLRDDRASCRGDCVLLGDLARRLDG